MKNRYASGPYEIIPYQPEFKQQILELQTVLWSSSLARNRAYFEWKHERNPYVSSPIVYLALARGKVVGMRGFFGVQWQAGLPPQILTGLYADDMAIAPGHRNRGLIPLIMHAAFDDLARLGYEFLFSLSAGPVTYVSSMASGWRSAGSARPMCYSTWDCCSSESSPGFLNQLSPDLVNRHFGDEPAVSFTYLPPLEIMCGLVERQGTDGRIRHVRDRAYFEWRFQNPLSSYAYLFCEAEGLAGYLVLQEYTSERADPTVLNIVDWEAASVAVLSRLLEAACRVAGDRKRLVIWSATLPEERLALLRQIGFGEVQEQGVGSPVAPILIRALAADRPTSDWLLAGRRLADLDDWDLRMLYSMHG